MDAPTSYNHAWTEEDSAALREWHTADDVPRSALNPKYPRMVGEFVYKGCHFVNWTSRARISRVEKDFEFFPDDLLLATFPKSGTTLMQEILWLLFNGANIEAARKTRVYIRFPFLEENYSNNFPGMEGEVYPLDYLPSAPRPRLIKTHLPWRILGARIEQNPAMKVVVVMRNPKDTAVSYYHFYKGTIDYGPFRGSWADFWRMWLDGWIAAGDWLSVTREWAEAARRYPQQVRVFKFEQLLKDPCGAIREVAAFVGRPCDADTAAKIAGHVHFSKMAANAMTNYSGVGGFTPEFRFMRKGQVGDWKNWFTVAQDEQFQAEVEPKLQEAGLEFDFE